jgi:transposase
VVIQNIQLGEKTKGNLSLLNLKTRNGMKKKLKQVVGIDVAQKELVVTIGVLFDDLSIEFYAYKVFPNNERSFDALLKWVKKLIDNQVPVSYVMEATGVYHQKFAYYLEKNKQDVSIVLPNKISNYMRTLDLKTVTDKSCSEAIARFGLERQLSLWKRPKEIYKKLQQLVRERNQIVDERVMVKNQLHAEQTEAEPNVSSISRIKARIKFLSKQEQEIKKDINVLLHQDPSITEEVAIMTTIPGVGQLTAVTILAETNGFELIKNKKQLVSYAGLDVKEKQSGTSVKGKARISKKGNKNLRKALHLPALSAIKHNDNFKEVFARLVSKSGIKMKGVVAVQRKILELTYILHKNKSVYQKEYEINKRAQLQVVAAL